LTHKRTARLLAARNFQRPQTTYPRSRGWK
jgi:hypothetical protein